MLTAAAVLRLLLSKLLAGFLGDEAAGGRSSSDGTRPLPSGRSQRAPLSQNVQKEEEEEEKNPDNLN